MGLEKAIKSGKEKRKEYHGAKAVDSTCRNNGGCPHCESNRLHSSRKRLTAAEDQMREGEIERKLAEAEDEAERTDARFSSGAVLVAMRAEIEKVGKKANEYA